MSQLIRSFARNPVTANMLMFGIIALGLLLLPLIQREILPPLVRDTLTLSVVMSGASPSQTEEKLCLPLERAIEKVSKIESLRSVASQNRCQLQLILDYNADFNTLKNQIKAAIDTTHLPDTASQVQLEQNRQDLMLMRLTLSGEVDYSQLHVAAMQLKNALLQQGLNNVRLRDVRDQKILIEVTELNLSRYQLSLNEIAAAIKKSATDIPSGQMEKSEGVASLVVAGAFHSITSLREIPIRASDDGSWLRLKDIASINDFHANSQLLSRLNALPAISISVYQDEMNNVEQVAEIVERFLLEKQKYLPDEMLLTLVQDNSAYFNQRITMLGENAIAGLVLIFLCLAFFLRLRLAFWVSAGLPLAFLGAVIVLFLLGGSINMVSTFGLLLVLGVVVDDAIIIAENIYRHQQQSGNDLEGAIIGASELSKPVIFAALTTMMTFMPLAFLPGLEGRLMGQIPLVVIATLIFSLIECLLILPAHLSYENRFYICVKRKFIDASDKSKEKAEASGVIKNFIDNYYKPLLLVSLQKRYILFSVFVGVLAIAISLILSARVPVDFVSSVDAEVATGFVSFDRDVTPEVTRAAILKMEAAALALKAELREQFSVPQISHIRALIQDQATSGHVFMNLETSDKRVLSGDDIMALWRKKVGPIEGVRSLWFSARYQANAASQSLSFQLESSDNQALYKATKDLLQHLKSYDFVGAVADSYVNEHQEVRVTLRPTAFELGLNRVLVSEVISTAFMGVELPSLEQGGQQRSLLLRLPESERNTLWHLQHLPVRLADGSYIPMMAIADIDFAKTASSITRLDGRRIAHVSAGFDFSQVSRASLNAQVLKNFLPQLQEKHPLVSWRYSSVDRQRERIKNALSLGFIIAIAVIFMLMASLFKSYFQPLIILSAVPFALIGAMLGHLLFWQPLTIWSMAGVVAVSGIVVNDNMVLIYYINERLKEGDSLMVAVTEAGLKRFRPVVLTTITTFFALVPMMFEHSWEAQFLIPMAIAIGFGELFATAVSLLLVPALYLIGHDIALVFKLKSPKDHRRRIDQ